MSTATKPRYVKYMQKVAEFYSGQSRTGLTPRPGPGGFGYGLSRAEADEITQIIHDAIVASGGKTFPMWEASSPYQEQRLVDAYRRRGLVA